MRISHSKKTPTIISPSPCCSHSIGSPPMAGPAAGPALPGNIPIPMILAHTGPDFQPKEGERAAGNAEHVRGNDAQPGCDQLPLEEGDKTTPGFGEVRIRVRTRMRARMTMKMWHQQLPVHFATSPASCKTPDFTHPEEQEPQEEELGGKISPPSPPRDIQPKKGKKLLCDFNWLWSIPMPG